MTTRLDVTDAGPKKTARDGNRRKGISHERQSEALQNMRFPGYAGPDGLPEVRCGDKKATSRTLGGAESGDKVHKAVVAGLAMVVIFGSALDSTGWAGWIAAAGVLTGFLLAAWGMRKEGNDA